MSKQIRALFLDGPAGRLEALLNSEGERPTHAALVCHPHPLYGGTMHNKVVYGVAKVLNGFGLPVLRFNFRGVGLSAGAHDQGRGEVEDVRAALDWLGDELDLPILFAGFSFGAVVGLKAACPHARVVALLSLGTPVKSEAAPAIYDYEFLRDCAKPKLFISGSQDEFGPRAELQAVVAKAATPKKLVWIQGADHFFAGHLADVQNAIAVWWRGLTAANA